MIVPLNDREQAILKRLADKPNGREVSTSLPYCGEPGFNETLQRLKELGLVGYKDEILGNTPAPCYEAWITIDGIKSLAERLKG